MALEQHLDGHRPYIEKYYHTCIDLIQSLAMNRNGQLKIWCLNSPKIDHARDCGSSNLKDEDEILWLRTKTVEDFISKCAVSSKSYLLSKGTSTLCISRGANKYQKINKAEESKMHQTQTELSILIRCVNDAEQNTSSTLSLGTFFDFVWFVWLLLVFVLALLVFWYFFAPRHI